MPIRNRHRFATSSMVNETLKFKIMTIRTQNGETQNVASQGLGNTGVTLGAVALGLGLLNGNGLGNGLLGGGCRSNYVTKDELEMSMKIAEKDSRIALLESEKTTDAKLVDVYREATARDREIRELIAVNKAEQSAINASQMAWNAQAGATMATQAQQIATQAAQLAQILTQVVPSNKVCDVCGCC